MPKIAVFNETSDITYNVADAAIGRVTKGLAASISAVIGSCPLVLQEIKALFIHVMLGQADLPH